jgi:hypothetical protein
MAVSLQTAQGLLSKLKRFSTSLLPIDAGRRGECNRCGECCKLPFPCPFLRYDDQGLSSCAVYHARPPSCRKYPRIASENLTPATCGFYFIKVEDIGMATPQPEQASG